MSSDRSPAAKPARSSRTRSKPAAPASDQERLRAAIESLSPDRRSTAEQRRELYIGALRRAEQLAYDPAMPGSVQVTAVRELRQIAERLAVLDVEVPAGVELWGSDASQLEAR